MPVFKYAKHVRLNWGYLNIFSWLVLALSRSVIVNIQLQLKRWNNVFPSIYNTVRQGGMR